MWDTCELFVNCDVTCDLLCWIVYDLSLYVGWFEILHDFIGLRGLYGSSMIVWSLWWLLLYLCSYKLDGSVIVGIGARFNTKLVIWVFKTKVLFYKISLTTYSYIYWCVKNLNFKFRVCQWSYPLCPVKDYQVAK